LIEQKEDDSLMKEGKKVREERVKNSSPSTQPVQPKIPGNSK
jgi:hypothetical protein